MVYSFLIATTLITSLISGVLSMAGGMILMGIFSFFLSVPAAMALHGVAQTVSNGSRIWRHRKHIRWNVLIPYSVGSFLILLLFIITALVPQKGVIFILIGSFPFIALLVPRHINLDMERKLVVTTAQMLAGASSPILDVFYVSSKLTRYEILGTQAITQTLGHVIKLGYYAFFLTLSIDLPGWIFPAVIVGAIMGNWIGKQIIEKINDELFKRIGRYTIMLIGVVYLGKGVLELMPLT
jgi:uncharacterized membrane protein YfcA